jgi:hypothetical protein
LGANTCGIFTRPGVDYGVYQDLGNECVSRNKTEGERKDLDRILIGEEVNDFKSMSDYANGEKFFAVVASLHHQAGG